jgi:hypothetical protein
MQATAQLKPNLDLIQRTPKRLTATLPWQVVENLQLRADMEGRSLSNLVAYLLEASC